MFKKYKIRLKKKFWVRILSMNCIVMTAVIFLFTAIRYKTSVSAEKENVQDLLTQVAESSENQFEQMLEEMSRISLTVATASLTQEVIKDAVSYQGEGNYFDINQEEKRELLQYMQQISGTDIKNTSINIISISGDYLLLDLYVSVTLSRDEMLSISKMGQFDENIKYKFFTGFEADSYKRLDEPLFSFVRKISDEFGDYGYVEIQKSREELDEIFQISDNNFGIVSILVLDDTVFYVSEDTVWADCLDQLSLCDNSGEITTCTLDGDSCLVYSTLLKEYNFTVYTILPESYYNERITSELILLILQSVFLLLAIMVLIFLISWSIYRPVKELRSEMEHTDLNNLQLDIALSGDVDEIESFRHVFAQMIARIRHQNDELLQQKLRELQISFNALSAQVNPHFLHNTLYLIGLKGEEHDAPEILDMCSYLTHMMAYCVTPHSDQVLFSDEIKYMNDYLRLMKYRYLDTLEYSIDVGDGINNLKVPRFILQPLVENCFTHGFKNSSAKKFMIQISLYVKESQWVLIIEDNGNGFSAEDVSRIEKEFEMVRQAIECPNAEFVSQITGIGLINTYARLMICFSGNVQISVGTGSLSGGRVEIHCAVNIGTATSEGAN